jgi:GMP synthase (glutamine-hydrolysing)
MNICCLEHAPFEGPGSIASWAAARGHDLNRVRLYDGERLPDIRDIDLLVVMGGPMSVHDERAFPWLVPEKKLIGGCLTAAKITLGVCLGSQLLAEVLGAPVYPNRYKEIGWFPVERCCAAAEAPICRSLPSQFTVFQWHGDTYDLPPGAAHLAKSAACAVQAFEHPYAVGLQFHLELTPPAIRDLISECAADIGSGPYEQPPSELLAAMHHCETAGKLMEQILDALETRIQDSARW